MAGRSNYDTSTKGGNRSRGQETETLWHSRNRREWGHWIVVSYLGHRAYQQKAQHQARWQLQSVKDHFLFPLFHCFQNLSFLSSKMYNKKKKNPALPLYWLGFQRLKGTLFRSVFGLLEPLSMVQQQQKYKYWTMTREENKRGQKQNQLNKKSNKSNKKLPANSEN